MRTDLSSGTRDRILQAAIRLVRDGRAHELTVRRVAADAQCSTIGVYTHFGDKAGLLEAVIVDAFDDFATALAATDDLGDPGTRLRESAGAYRAWALAHPRRYLFMFTPSSEDFAVSPSVAERTHRVFLAHRRRVADAMASRAIAPGDADEIAHYLWAVVHGHVMLEILGAASAARTHPDQTFGRAVDRALGYPG
ncbi:TetR/AcrR family transcriptional regulator [Agromyces marinus]|uniref:TetR family transcriptional regulator n=1 Tax=Agromyces marinus TaxID=1389020 RepID=A0ABM8H4Q1_9MICO|nr:TetR-like C-terminal domain-containing protein [Agromyces marinus]UIP59211.1 hypothetical protein DSM26151_21120 [Agromyces marinus]BDZ55787.1 TetR family transcriptional regulator [Agromyces marinus]